MPDVTPTGPLAVAVDGLRTLIANSTFFQSWTGTADAAHALLRIFTGELGIRILSISISGGVMTVNTMEPHPFQVGDVVTLEGAAIGDESVALDGPQTVASVSTTSFTVTTGHAALSAVFPDGALVLPAARPIACICEEEGALKADIVGTSGASVFNGEIEILLEADTSTAYQNDSRNALYEARNAFGQFIQDIAQLQGTLDFMCLNRIEPVAGPTFIDRAEQKNNTVRFDRWQALIRVTWGLDA